jgi:putative ABC transport system permease protein
MTVAKSDSSGRQLARLDLVQGDGGFFETIGARRVAGRFIGDDDVRENAKVAVINESAARSLFHDSSAIGCKLWYQDRVVIGVVREIRQRQLERATVPTVYVPLALADAGRHPDLAIRTSGKPEAIEDRIRRDVAAIDPTLVPIFETMEARVASEVAPRRFTFMLFGMFALLAAALAIVGLYGLLSFLVADRTREIGIRVALGADAARVRRFVIGQGVGLTVVGVAIGVGGSILGARALRSVVFESSVYDPRAFIASAVLLLVVAFVACYIPARRASRVDPIVALRTE